MERKLRAHVAGSKAEAFQVELHSDVAAILGGPNGEHLEELEKETGKRFAFKTKKSFRLDRFAVLAEGKASEIEAAAEAARGGEPRSGAERRPRASGRWTSARCGRRRGRAGAEPDGDEPTEKPKKRRGAGRVAAAVARRRPRRPATAAEAERRCGRSPYPPLEAVVEARRPARTVTPRRGEAEEEARRGRRGGRRRKKKPPGETPSGRLRRWRTLARLSLAAGPTTAFPVYEL